MLLSHEPLLNRQRAITATRLVVHTGSGDASACASAAAELNALADVWPSQRTVIVSFGDHAPDRGILEWQVPENAMVEIPASALGSDETREVLTALQEGGIPVCVGGYTSGDALPADVPFRFVFTAEGARAAARVPGLLIAANLPDHAAFEACLRNGFDGAAGWFFLNNPPTAKKLAPAHAQIVRLLNLVRNNADLKEIEYALKQDVALSFKLLRYINSAGFGLSCEIQSFRHAVTILGYDKLNRWLSLLLVTAGKDPAAPSLMQAAIARGRMMELAGQGFFSKSELDNLFITGAFSLLDVLLGAPMETVLDQMHLPEAISEALVDHEGVFGPFLELALACEGVEAAELARQADTLQLHPESVNRAQLASLTFADRLQFS
jgi:EAL and modified HD-GYP domain-containing signal transduction protein